MASFQHWRKLSSSHLRMKAQRESCLLCFLSWSLHTACFDFLLKLLKIKETALSPSPKECSPHSVCAGPQKRECPRAKFHVQMNLLLVLGGRWEKGEEKAINTVLVHKLLGDTQSNLVNAEVLVPSLHFPGERLGPRISLSRPLQHGVRWTCPSS